MSMNKNTLSSKIRIGLVLAVGFVASKVKTTCLDIKLFQGKHVLLRILLFTHIVIIIRGGGVEVQGKKSFKRIYS